MKIAQIIRLNNLMLLEGRLKFAMSTTCAFSFCFLIMALILVIIPFPAQWLEPVLWLIAIIGVVLQGLTAFGRPEKWHGIATTFFSSTMMLTAVIALIGTFQ